MKRLRYFPLWACPGPCDMSPSLVAWTKQDLGPGLALHISEYWGKHTSIRKGLANLRKLFCWTNVVEASVVPPPDVSHQQLLDILHTMRDGIDPANDPFPSPEVVQAGRERYKDYMCRLRRVDPPVLATQTSLAPTCTRLGNHSNRRHKVDGTDESAGSSGWTRGMEHAVRSVGSSMQEQ